MRAIEEGHGLSRGEPWLKDQGPEPWEELRHRWQQQVDALFSDLLEEQGEDEMARLFREDPATFEGLTEKGRRRVLSR